MRESGRLIAFEGVEGAGKSTHLHHVADELRRRGFSVLETREPGGTPIGVEIRRLLMDCPDTPPNPLAELLLYLADRAQHLSDVIVPGVRNGQIVLTDRFSASTIAYQGYARQLDVATVTRLDGIVRNGITPALTLLLDCPVAVGLRRARGTDRFHREEHAFHERVRNAFLTFARDDPQHYCVVDATQPSEAVQQQVMDAVLRCLAQS